MARFIIVVVVGVVLNYGVECYNLDIIYLLISLSKLTFL